MGDTAKWVEPKLIIIKKSTAEENVLYICKNGTVEPSGPGNYSCHIKGPDRCHELQCS